MKVITNGRVVKQVVQIKKKNKSLSHARILRDFLDDECHPKVFSENEFGVHLNRFYKLKEDYKNKKGFANISDEDFIRIEDEPAICEKQSKQKSFQECSARAKRSRTDNILQEIEQASIELDIDSYVLCAYLGYRITYVSNRLIANAFHEIELTGQSCDGSKGKIIKIKICTAIGS